MEVRSRGVSGASVSPGYARQKCLAEYDIKASTCLFVIIFGKLVTDQILS